MINFWLLVLSFFMNPVSFKSTGPFFAVYHHPSLSVSGVDVVELKRTIAIVLLNPVPGRTEQRLRRCPDPSHWYIQLWFINLRHQILHTTVQEYNISLPIDHSFVSRYTYHCYPASMGVSGSPTSGAEKGPVPPASSVSISSKAAAASLLRFTFVAGLRSLTMGRRTRYRFRCRGISELLTNHQFSPPALVVQCYWTRVYP